MFISQFKKFKRASIIDFLAHIFSHFPLSLIVLALTILLLLLEYIGISLMIPLASSNQSDTESWIVRFWLDVISKLDLNNGVATWLWLFIIVLSIRTIFGFIHEVLASKLAKQVHRKLSADVFRRVVLLESMDQVYSRSIGYYISLAGDDTFRAGSLINGFFLMLARLFSSMISLVMIFVFSKIIFGASIAFLMVSSILILGAAKLMLSKNYASIALSREAGTNFLETLNNLRSIRSIKAGNFLSNLYADQVRNYTNLLFQIDVIRVFVKLIPGIIALIVGAVVLSPWASVLLEIDTEAALAGTTLILRFFASLGAFVTVAGSFMIDMRSAQDIRSLIVDHESNAENPKTLSIPSEPVTSISLNDVGYSYPNRISTIEALKYEFLSGKCYAIIGPSGSGKSTIADLILGLLNPEQGSISVNGRELTGVETRDGVILVEQQSKIFSLSIRENLLMGMTVSDNKIWEALDLVDLADYVKNLPRQLNSIMEYQGANLSGGQRQRLAIARALLCNPDVLILDEATSALDPLMQELIVKRLIKFMDKKIIIFITHNSEVASLADEIIRL